MTPMMRRPLQILMASLVCSGWVGAAAPKGLPLGGTLPAFKLPGVDGKMHTDREYKAAKVLVLVFTCNHCPTAQAYEKRIIQLEKDYRDKGVTLVAISPNNAEAVRLDELGYADLGDSLADMKIRAKQRNFAFPYLYDGETQEFSAAVGVKVTPHVFIFDADRKLRFNGRIDNSEVGTVTTQDTRNALDDLLAGREVKVPQTRVFGCSTKWKSKKAGALASDERWAKEPVTLADIDIAGVKKLAANTGENYLLVNVWATSCGPCVAEMPEFVVMQRMYRRRHFKLVTLSVDKVDQKARALAFLKRTQAAMTNYLVTSTDRDALAEALAPKWTGPLPYTALIAPGGKVIYRKEGPIDAQELKGVIADTLGRTYANRKPKPKPKKRNSRGVK
jgi:thiol-disulfide isomerase/thioredoxin